MNREPTRRQNVTSPPGGVDLSSVPLLGSRVADHYEVFEVNEGGFGWVLGVADIYSGERLAVKIPKQSDQAESVDEFAAEVAIWVELDPHPNIVTARFVHAVRGGPGLFMDFVEGASFRSLRELLNIRSRLPEETAISFGHQICRGMKFANRDREVVHLDLKPENLLIEDGTLLKITDFGLAHRVRIVGGTYERRYAGSWPYSAPERFRKEPCDTRTDMFSVGIIFYEMLTGELPYPFALSSEPADAYAQLAEFHKKDGMEKIVDDLYHSGLPGLGSHTTELLSTCLHPTRAERPMHFRTAEALFAELAGKKPPKDKEEIECSPHDPLSRIGALQAVGDHAAALTMLNKLLVKEPGNGDYYLAAARSLAMTGQERVAEDFRRRARALGTKHG
jgi:serine/threonine protein kinase